jgi:hypothetical protein
MTAQADALKSQLFGGQGNVFAVLDGASVPGLLDALYRTRAENACLYRGELEPNLAEAAPYLVQLDPDGEFTDWVLEQGWGNHWGVFAAGAQDFLTMRQHFRQFIVVHDPEGKPLYFRYYDPRVLRVYLPSCNPGELRTLFGPVGSYLIEDENPEIALRFRFQEDALLREELQLAKK